MGIYRKWKGQDRQHLTGAEGIGEEQIETERQQRIGPEPNASEGTRWEGNGAD